MRHEGIPCGVHVALLRDGAVLLMRRAGTGFFDGLYSLPGGHIEAGESVWQTAIREMREEVGVSIGREALSPLGVVHRLSDTNRVDFFLAAHAWQGTPRICEVDKCDGLGWFPRHALPANTVPYVQEALGRTAVPWFFETGWETV